MKMYSMLTSKWKILYADSVILKNQLWPWERCITFKNKVSAAKSRSENILNSKLTNHMTTDASIYYLITITNNKAKRKIFTFEEKLLSLSLYTNSIKSYKILFIYSHYMEDECLQIVFLNYLSIPEFIYLLLNC